VIGVRGGTVVCGWRLDGLCGGDLQSLSLRMVSARVVGVSVADGGPSRDSGRPDDLFQSG